MGCWNETCGISQMPICGGDQVRMFLIVSNSFDSSDDNHSYTTDLWRPFGLPLKGTYDEYGRIENIEEDALSDVLLQSLKEMVIELPNRMGDIFKREKLTWETAIDFLTDEGLRITDPHRVAHFTKELNILLAEVKELVPDLPENGWSSDRSKLAKKQKDLVKKDRGVVRMYHMMVHEDIYQALTTKYKAPASRFSSWTDGNLREELEKDAKEYIIEFRKDLESTKGMSEYNLARHEFSRLSDRSIGINKFASAANHLTGNYGSGSYFRKYLDFIEKKIKEGAADDDADIKSLTNQFIDFICFSRCMSLLRKMWAPQCGKGGQDREYAIHKFLGETIASFSEKKIKEWDEEYGEDIDDSEEEEDDAEEDK